MYELIEVTDDNIKELTDLAIEAHQEGYRFVQRTIDEWLLRKNDFSKPGEIFYAIKVDGKVVSIGGINVDPYVHDKSIGRIRHVYTSKEYRRRGYSKLILNKLISNAGLHFKVLRLSTNNEFASKLYVSLGFTKHMGHKVTHLMKL